MSGIKVALVMGSKSDKEHAEKAETILKEFGVDFKTFTLSAHRNPNKIKKFAKSAEESGFGVIVAMAGLAAHLPGVLASLTVLPVVGVPIESGPLRGEDALLSIVQMPPGIPVATVGIGNTKNAALLAVQILSVHNLKLREKMKEYRGRFGDDLD
ncbi:MAG TPA: 5-(carboxyamino)imidazole ribonucleotide mutase [Chitinivibrionales bacterium]|jgi:phosphoribosylaminoimidazole carboxylase PurE protein|nr:5-(carboxyamino)imidazole ribonucleotide mutase [Chitinivibrionales bacterium]